MEPKFEPLRARFNLRTCAALAEFFAPDSVLQATKVFVKLKTLVLDDHPALAVAYKQYEYRKPSWRFWGRASKAQCEFRNYKTFRDLGISSAERIAYGEQRDRVGRLRRAFIMTVEIPGAQVLSRFVGKYCPNRSTHEYRNLRDILLLQLAAMTHRIHQARFFYNDLYWRNILVTGEPPADPTLWWIDCPRGRFVRWPPWQYHCRIKDLASLDKCAAKFCTSNERLNFVKQYLGKTRFDSEVKRIVRDSLAYRKRRWPDGG